MAKRIFAVAICTMFCCLQVSSSFDTSLCAGSGSTGMCSTDPLPVPTRAAQDDMMLSFMIFDFKDGNVTGCYSRRHDDDFLAHASFTCDGAPSEACRQCLSDGFNILEEGCKARAGGTILMRDCCVRYETAYNICGHHRHH
ncbi:unnamed protein product [Linum trigynum]|uniref:Gnk2-homologous domain-containing protein n=1 Tax=Linum trigynum TaxID=586398 RepID=A0AAV2GER8_9ROSI